MRSNRISKQEETVVQISQNHGKKLSNCDIRTMDFKLSEIQYVRNAWQIFLFASALNACGFFLLLSLFVSETTEWKKKIIRFVYIIYVTCKIR